MKIEKLIEILDAETEKARAVFRTDVARAFDVPLRFMPSMRINSDFRNAMVGNIQPLRDYLRDAFARELARCTDAVLRKDAKQHGRKRRKTVR